MQSDPLQVRRIHSLSDLAPYLDAWRQLSSGAPMRSPEWLLAWWEIYAAPGDELSVLLIRAPGGRLIGLAPLYLQSAKGSAIFRLLGSDSVCTNHTTWISAGGWESRVGIEVARFLLNCRSSWKRLLFDAVDTNDVALLATVTCLTEHGCFLRKRQMRNCWKIALPETWDDYLGMLSKSRRKRCRHLQRQFFDSGIIKVRQVESEAELQQGFDILLKLHAARWGSPQNPLGVFDDQRLRRFHERVSRELLAQKKLRLAWLEYNGRPIAVEYQFVDSNTVYAYQAGVDLSMDKYSPGMLSVMAAIQFAMAKGCDTFDLLRGDEPYKASWHALPLAFHDLDLWQDGIAGRSEWVMWSLYQLAARLLKPIIPEYLLNRCFQFVHAVRDVGGHLRRRDR